MLDIYKIIIYSKFVNGHIQYLQYFITIWGQSVAYLFFIQQNTWNEQGRQRNNNQSYLHFNYLMSNNVKSKLQNLIIS